MEDWFVRAATQLGDTPWLQATVAALATFILEDPTTVSCGLLVAEGRMLFITAFVGLSIGIAAGDFGLYAIGRLAGPATVAWGLLSQERLDRTKRWFDRNVVVAVIVSRFLPGTRLPTYVGAGIFQASALRFLIAAVGASMVWTFLLLTATIKIGEAVLPMLGRFKWPVAIAAIIFIVLIQRRASMKLAQEGEAVESGEAPVVSRFEFWPPTLFYIPVGFYYTWLAVRFRSFTLPTAANPSIYSGGLILESKSQILDLVPEPHRGWLASYGVYKHSGADTPVTAMVDGALKVMKEAGLDFPIVAKPDVGQRGAGVQCLHSEQDLGRYLRAFPADCDVILQRLADYPHEAGVMYYRYPGESEGRIFSITLKEFPTVTGDGQRTLRELILADRRARLLQHIYFPRHAEKLDTVLPEGERFRLVFAGNHARGAVFRDGTHLATPELLARLHTIASAIPEYYFGRFDVRFPDLDRFLQGEDFTIVEINGAGAEATHIWDRTQTLSQAYHTLFEQFRVLFEIGARNRSRGFRTLGPMPLLRDCLAYRRTSRAYPPSH